MSKEVTKEKIARTVGVSVDAVTRRADGYYVNVNGQTVKAVYDRKSKTWTVPMGDNKLKSAQELLDEVKASGQGSGLSKKIKRQLARKEQKKSVKNSKVENRESSVDAVDTQTNEATAALPRKMPKREDEVTAPPPVIQYVSADDFDLTPIREREPYDVGVATIDLRDAPEVEIEGDNNEIAKALDEYAASIANMMRFGGIQTDTGEPSKEFRGVYIDGELAEVVHKTYHYVSHADFIGAVAGAIKMTETRFTGVKVYTTYGKRRLFVHLKLPTVNIGNDENPDPYDLEIVLRNSVDGSMRLGAEIAGERLVCTNGLLMRAALLSHWRRHIGAITLDRIGNILRDAGVLVTSIQEFLSGAKTTTISKADAIKKVDKLNIPKRQQQWIKDIIEQRRAQMTLYDLWNMCTYVISRDRDDKGEPVNHGYQRRREMLLEVEKVLVTR